MSLITEPAGAASHARSGGGVEARIAGGTGKRGKEEEEEVLEVRPSPGSGGKALRLRVLDGVSLRVSEWANYLPSEGSAVRQH